MSSYWFHCNLCQSLKVIWGFWNYHKDLFEMLSNQIYYSVLTVSVSPPPPPPKCILVISFFIIDKSSVILCLMCVIEYTCCSIWCLGGKAQYVKDWFIFTFWSTAEQWKDFTVGFDHHVSVCVLESCSTHYGLWRYFLLLQLDCNHENRGVSTVILKSWVQLLISDRGLSIIKVGTIFLSLDAGVEEVQAQGKARLKSKWSCFDFTVRGWHLWLRKPCSAENGKSCPENLFYFSPLIWRSSYCQKSHSNCLFQNSRSVYLVTDSWSAGGREVLRLFRMTNCWWIGRSGDK